VYSVRISVFGRDDRLKTIERSFDTDEERTRWLEKQEEKEDFHEVLAFSDDAG
jgi:hypothetical protein